MSLEQFPEEVQELIERIIDSESELDAIQATYALGELKDKTIAKKALIIALQNQDPEVLLSTLDVLCNPNFMEEDILDSLAAILNNESPDVRIRIVEIMGNIKSEKSANLLIEALKNEEELDVKHDIMAAMAANGNVKAASILKKYAISEFWEDRKNAIDAIGMLAEPNSRRTMIRALQDPSPQVREQAALSIGFFKDEEVIDELIELIEDEVTQVQAAAVYTLGEFQSNEAIPYILDLLMEDNDDLVLIAIEALGKIKSEKTIPDLIEFLDHPSPDVRMAAMDSLNVFKLKVIIDPIIQAFILDPKYSYLQNRISKIPEDKIDKLEVNEWDIPKWAIKLVEGIKNKKEKPEKQ